MDALSESYRQYAKPRRSAVTRVSGEHGGWRLTAGAYLLVPFTRATRSAFPRDWTILLTFRPAAAYQVHNTKQTRRRCLTMFRSCYSTAPLLLLIFCYNWQYAL